MKILAVCITLFLFACSDAPSNADLPSIPKGSDAGYDFPDIPKEIPKGRLSLDKTTPQKDIDPKGAKDIETKLDGSQARIGTTKDNAGFHGVFAHCKKGDFKLYNNLVEFCVQGLETNRYEFFHGGLLVDARRSGDTSEDVFDVWAPRYKLNVFDVQAIYVVRDGSDGGPAVLRADGIDMPVAHFVGALGSKIFKSFENMTSVEYRIYPDSPYLEIVMWTSHTRNKPKNVTSGELFGFGERTRVWNPQKGFDLSNIQSTNFFIGQEEKVSFGWFREEPSRLFTSVIGAIPWFLAEDPDSMSIGVGEEYATRRYIIVGDGSVESIVKTKRELEKTTPLKPRTLRLEYEDGTPAINRGVEIFNDDLPISFAKSNTEGLFTFSAKESTKVEIAPLFGGEKQTFVLNNEKEKFVLSTPAKINILAKDLNGRISASVTIIQKDKRKTYVVTSQQPSPQSVAPGTYDVVVDHGMEWDIAQEKITIQSGESKEVTLLLTRVLDTTNMISGDFHQHMEPSIDSEVSIRDRILDNVGQGVEFLAPTDHEVVTDLLPYITELGLNDEIRTVSGIEVSPTYAHMNWFPMEYKADERARGSVPLAIIEDGKPLRRTFPDMIALARKLPTDPIIQINHGRGGSGYFNSTEFDPATGKAGEPDEFSTDFDAMEVMNDEDEVCLLIQDWAAFLNAGQRPTAMGNSDTHGLWRGVGDNRNFIVSPTDDPKEIDPQEVKQALLQNQSIIARFALIDFPAAKPGDLISTDKNTAIDLKVRVQTPPYSRIDTILVFANGVIIDTIDVSSQVEDIVDYEKSYALSFQEDTWVSFIAWGPPISNIINEGEIVFSMTNPIFVDVDGDTDSDGNMFEAPGPGKLDIEALDRDLDVKGICKKRE